MKNNLTLIIYNSSTVDFKEFKEKVRHNTRIIFWYALLISAPFVFIFMLALIPHIAWRIAKESKVIELAVIDKTVPFETYREHMGLYWILHYDRYVHPNKKDYDPAKDYIGYYPDNRDNPVLFTYYDIAGKDLVYIADSYGVYTLDLEDIKEEEAALDYSQLIFGGIEEIELKALQNYAKRGGTIVTEFNFFADPTSDSIRNSLEDILHVEWLRWSGRFFQDLGSLSEIPKWLPRLYETQYAKKYNFKGPGIIYVSDGGQVVILERGKDFTDYPYIVNDPEVGDIVSDQDIKAPFFYWFDIVQAYEDTKVYANYEFNFLERGKKQLAEFGIPETFPAIIEHKGEYTSYYFAGDFADTPINGTKTSKFLIFPTLMKLWSHIDTSASQHQFFWRFYMPLIRNILEETYEKNQEI